MRNNSSATSFATIRGVKSQDVKKSYNKPSNIFTLSIKKAIPQASYTTLPRPVPHSEHLARITPHHLVQ